KPGLLETIRLEFQSVGSRKSRFPLVSEEDEDRSAVIVKEYTARHDIGLFSDHRPVTAVFAVRFDWNLTDRGVIRDQGPRGIGSGSHANMEQHWGPLDKVLERIGSAMTTPISVSKPSTASTDNMDKTSTPSTAPDADTAMKEPSLSSPTTTTTSITTAKDLKPTTSTQDTPRPEKRRLANNGEDTRRNKRMMGMILGTLAQSKRQTPVPSIASTTNSDGTPQGGPGTTGISSREAIQARVREKLEREKRLYQEQEAQEREERHKLWTERNELQRQRQRDQLQSRRAAIDSARDTRGPPRWTGTDYILTETTPRLRYLPKVLSAVAKEKLEKQTRERVLERERIRERAPVDPRQESHNHDDDNNKESRKESETTSTTTTAKTTEGEEKSESSTGEEKPEKMDTDLVVDVKASGGDGEKEKEGGNVTEAPSASSASTGPASEVKGAKDDEDVDMEPKKDDPPELINISLV
ncbi:hypothetical protein BGZ59_002687, partial [Podila verticillata]